MSHSQHSLPLVRMDRKENMVPVESTLAKLVAQPLDIVKTVCIVGPARSGKSYLLNYLAGNKRLFHVENRGCVTKGVDSSARPVLLDETPTLLVDIEGMGDRSQDYDFRLSLPILATADVILLNIRGQPGKQEMLNLLNRFVFMYHQVFANAKPLNLRPFLFPSLIVVMRDWTNRKDYEKEYSANILNNEASRDATAKEHNQIRLILRKCFQSIELISLPLPASPELLEESDQLSFADLSPSFKAKVATLRDQIVVKLRSPVNTIFGNRLGTVAELTNSWRHLIAQVNAAEFHLPTVLDQLTAFRLAQLSSAMHKWIDNNCPTPTLPANPAELAEVLMRRRSKISDEYYRQSAQMDASDDQAEKFLEEIQVDHDKLMAENRGRLKSLFQDVFDAFMESVKQDECDGKHWKSEFISNVKSQLKGKGVFLSFAELAQFDPELNKLSARVEEEEEKHRELRKQKKEVAEMRSKFEELKLENDRLAQRTQAVEQQRMWEQVYSQQRESTTVYSSPYEYSTPPAPPVDIRIQLEQSSASRLLSSAGSQCSDRSVGISPRGNEIFEGPRHGQYHLSASGNKVYHSKPAAPASSPTYSVGSRTSTASPAPSRISSSAAVGHTPTGLTMMTGSRGGTYHISSGGNKVYHKK